MATLLFLIPVGLKAAVFDGILSDVDKSWVETPEPFPAAPGESDLLPFNVGPTSSFKFKIDSKSLSLGKDRVFRLTIVAISDEGVRNVTFEGFRCATMELKVYAFGQPDGSWVANRRDDWFNLVPGRSAVQDLAVAKDLLCVDGIPVSTKDVLARLKSHRENPDLRGH